MERCGQLACSSVEKHVPPYRSSTNKAFVAVQHRPAASKGEEPRARPGTTSRSHPSTPVREAGQPRAAITRQGHRDELHPRLGREAMLWGCHSLVLSLGYSFMRCGCHGRSIRVTCWIPGQGPGKSPQGCLRMYSGENLRGMDGMLDTFYQEQFIFRGVRQKGKGWCHLTPKWELVYVLD